MELRFFFFFSGGENRDFCSALRFGQGPKRVRGGSSLEVAGSSKDVWLRFVGFERGDRPDVVRF